MRKIKDVDKAFRWDRRGAKIIAIMEEGNKFSKFLPKDKNILSCSSLFGCWIRAEIGRLQLKNAYEKL